MTEDRADEPRFPHEVVRASGLTKRFGKLEAVSGLNVVLSAGKILGLLGPNGSGKTTTLRLLMGLSAPSSGAARVLGFDTVADGDAIRRSVGYVPERHFMYPWMQVAQVIRFTGSFYPTWDRAAADELRDRFQLPANALVRHLSNGMQAKLALLLALAHAPSLLILDEPTGGLDPLAREEFIDTVAEAVHIRQQSVIFSTHIVADIERISDIIGIMYRGRLLMQANVESIRYGAKRLQIVGGREHFSLPDARGVVRTCRNTEGWVITVAECSPDFIDAVNASPDVVRVEAQSIGLEELFKEACRGAKERGE